MIDKDSFQLHGTTTGRTSGNLPPALPRIQPKTIITGCEFWDSEAGMYCHGDLWQMPSVFIFNAVLNKDGQAAWQRGIPDSRSRVLITHSGCYAFERRGVLVIPASGAFLNDTATEYLKGAA